MRALSLLLLIFLTACGGKPDSSAPLKPSLLVTIAPYQTLVARIAGDAFDVQAVVPANADPHSYEPTSRQVAQMMNGRIWFCIGEPFEKKLLPLLPQTKQLDLRDRVSMIDDEGHCEHCGEDHRDRHIWLSPKQLSIQAEAIAEALSNNFPDQADVFQARLGAVQQALETLDRDIQDLLSPALARTFLVSHPAFAYFCRDYDCHQLSIEQEGKDPRPKELEEL